MPESSISFSQYYTWKNCPRRWKLKYIDNIRINIPSVAAMFGTAMHETLQEYLTVVYNDTIIKANEMDLHKMLRDKMKIQYKTLLEENNNVHFSSTSELSDYYYDGVQILDYFKKNRDSIFPKKNYELVGIELPINIVASPINENVKMVGFIDIVVKDTSIDKYYIYDFKTSTSGWGKYQKQDKAKQSQLVLYKKFFSDQYKCDPSQIEIEYLILKRKLQEDAIYPSMSKRIQRHAPSHGIVSLKKAINDLSEFIQSVFNDDGSYNTSIDYQPTAGFNNSNCRFCEYKENDKLCPKNERILT